ncbi:hypothetical protein [Metapseudomonas otitidis]|nr:hypothetical protein [Pseudomonas otitidis]MDG9783084.1 hypothetical protein [Pseudomonas otitidis]
MSKDIRVSFTIRPWFWLVSPVGVLCFVGFFHLPWGAESAPAWVQAIGSVAAIIAAIWIFYRQTEFQIQSKRDKEAQLLRLALSLGRHAAGLINLGATRAEQREAGLAALQILTPVLEEWEGVLSEISIESLPNPEAAAAWVEIRQCLRGGRRSVVSGLAAPAFPPDEIAIVKRMAEMADVAVQRLFASAQEHLPELKVNVEFT